MRDFIRGKVWIADRPAMTTKRRRGLGDNPLIHEIPLQQLELEEV